MSVIRHLGYLYGVPSVVQDVAFGAPEYPGAHCTSTSNNLIPEGVKSGKPFELLLWESRFSVMITDGSSVGVYAPPATLFVDPSGLVQSSQH